MSQDDTSKLVELLKTLGRPKACFDCTVSEMEDLLKDGGFNKPKFRTKVAREIVARVRELKMELENLEKGTSNQHEVLRFSSKEYLDFPKFNEQKVVESLANIDKYLATSTIQPQDICLLLVKSMSSDTAINKMIGLKQELECRSNITWPHLKRMIAALLSSFGNLNSYTEEMKLLKPLPGELMSDYHNRYTAYQAIVQMDPMIAGNNFRNTLPMHYQDNLGILMTARAVQAFSLDDMIECLNQSYATNSRCYFRLDAKPSIPTEKRALPFHVKDKLAKRFKLDKYCEICKKTNHNTNEHRSRKELLAQKSATSSDVDPKPVVTAVTGKKSLICNYCKKKGHTADKCWEKHGRPNKKETSGYVSAVNASNIIDNNTAPIVSDETKPLHPATNSATDSVNDYTPGELMYKPITLHDIPVNGLLDSGSQMSIIRKDVYDKIKQTSVWAVEQLPHKVTLEFGNAAKTQECILVKLYLKYEGQEAMHGFVVASELSTECILGTDSMFKYWPLRMPFLSSEMVQQRLSSF